MAVFLVVTRYTRSLDEVDEVRLEHLDWIEGLYAAGQMFVSGRQTSGDGGVLVLQARDEGDAASLLAGDPFVREGIVEIDIIAFDPTAAALKSNGFGAFYRAL